MAAPSRHEIEAARLRLGEGIRQQRFIKGHTITEVARRSGISRTMLSKIEHGQCGASSVTVHSLVQALDAPERVSTDWFNCLFELSGVRIPESEPPSKLPSDGSMLSPEEWPPLIEASSHCQVLSRGVPALLQTHGFVAYILSGITDSAYVNAFNASRHCAQATLWDSTRQFEFIIEWPSALDMLERLDGAERSGQLLHLLRMAQKSNIHLMALTDRVLERQGVADTTIFDGRLMVHDAYRSGLLISDPRSVRINVALFDFVAGEAVAGDDLIDFLHTEIGAVGDTRTSGLMPFPMSG